MQRSLFRIVLVLLALSPLVSTRAVDAAPPAHDLVRLLAWGDWGFESQDPKRVAAAMAAYNATHPADGAILLGDNFRVHDQTDAGLLHLFEGLYARNEFDFPFYPVLGNHDYEGHKSTVELGYQAAHPGTRWQMASNWYRVDVSAAAKEPLVTVLCLDSNHDSLGSARWAEQIQWIKDQLSRPRGKWVICCAHHTMFSNGGHGDNGVLQREWGTVFKENKVDFYLCGHDHTLQHLEVPDWPISFVISGGGGAARKEMLRSDRGPFSRSTTGFAAFEFTSALATIRLIGEDGNVMHASTRDSEGKVQTITNTDSDPATQHPLRVIQGIDGPAATQVGK